MLYLYDGSTILGAVLLIILLPPNVPLITLAFTLLFMVVIGKHIYGGVGQNLFNPAMAAYVFALLAFPKQTTNWSFQSIDAQSGASALDIANRQEVISLIAVDKYFVIFSLLALLGGIFLMVKKIISWHIPIGFIATFALLNTLFFYSLSHPIDPLSQLVAGNSLILGAFFILTDPTTAPASRKGQLLFAAIIATVVVVIRNFSTQYPDAVAFAVLVGNMLVPLIDKITIPKPYGK